MFACCNVHIIMFKLKLNSKNNPPTKKMDLFKAAVSKVCKSLPTESTGSGPTATLIMMTKT